MNPFERLERLPRVRVHSGIIPRYQGADVLRTPNPECPACHAFRFHLDEEWTRYHPKAGTGIEHRIAPGN